MSQDYNEVLCQAVDIIVSQRISNLKFDETIVCTIVDDTNSNSGEYLVTENGQLKFKAYSEYINYTKGEQVYVHISKDTTQKKLILSRYIENFNDIQINATLPSKTIVQMSPNLLQGSYAPLELIANSEYKNFYITTITNLPQNNRIYDTLCLRANFKCLLNNWNVLSGSYGIKAILISRDAQNAIISQTVIFLDSEQDMHGNPYVYDKYYLQEQVYNLNLKNDITEIALYAYQKADFIYNDNINSAPQRVPEALVPNIFIDSIEIFFAYNTLNINGRKVKIYSDENESYDQLTHKIHLMWYNNDAANNYIGFDDGTFDENKAKFSPEEEIYYAIHWYQSTNYGVWTRIYLDDITRQEIQLTLNPNQDKTYIKAEVIRNGEYYTSNILTFTNANQPKVITDATLALNINGVLRNVKVINGLICEE